MKIVLLIPGLKDKNATALLRLRPYLEEQGFLVRALPYGWFFLRGFLWQPFNLPVARMLAGITELLHSLGHQIVCVCHSNGATIATEASKAGAYFDVLMFVNGAVERDVKLGQNTGWLINVNVPTDPVLNIARVIGPVTPWADWDGSLGSSGVKSGSDPRMWNLDATETWGIRVSHGGVLSEQMVPETAPVLIRNIEHSLQYPYPKEEELLRT